MKISEYEELTMKQTSKDVSELFPEHELNLTQMMEKLAASFTEERKKKEPYREMFKSGSSYTSLFRHLESEMGAHVLDACTVIKERYGMSVNRNQYNFLLALPLLVKFATDDAIATEGLCCCVDKAFFMLSEEFKKLAA